MVVIQPVSSEFKVNYPDHVSEFEVHAALFKRLREEIVGVEFRGEVKSRGTHGLRKAKTACRFDLAGFRGDVCVCIIEVKGGVVRHNTCIEDTRQGIRYPTFGVPVIVCYGMDDLDEVVEFIRTHI